MLLQQVFVKVIEDAEMYTKGRLLICFKLPVPYISVNGSLRT
jgi:hypothetical protein